MQKRNTTLVWIVGIIVLIALIGGYVWFTAESREQAAARELVTTFGAHLNDVSLLAPDAADQIARAYEPYVAPALLAIWRENPEQAPGRQTSSPWPESIQVRDVTRQGESYIVMGNVVMKTSVEATGENAGLIPVVILVTNIDGDWKISAYEEPQTQS